MKAGDTVQEYGNEASRIVPLSVVGAWGESMLRVHYPETRGYGEISAWTPAQWAWLEESDA